jgi:hypothetical protein
VAAGALLVAYTALSRHLPRLPVRADIMVSSVIVVALMTVLLLGLLPLAVFGRRLLILPAAALPLAVLFVWLGLVPLADLAKIIAAGGLGLWIAGELERVSWVVIAAVVSAAVDAFSVAAGPTKALLAKGPLVIGYFIVAVTWWGYSYEQAYTGLGTSDVIFFALYLASARRFGLRVRASAVVMAASFLVTIAAAMLWTALPALPLLSLAFLAVNGDLLWPALRGRGAEGGDSGADDGDPGSPVA